MVTTLNDVETILSVMEIEDETEGILKTQLVRGYASGPVTKQLAMQLKIVIAQIDISVIDILINLQVTSLGTQQTLQFDATLDEVDLN